MGIRHPGSALSSNQTHSKPSSRSVDEILSPEIRATIEEKFRALVSRSQSVLLEALHTKPNPALALGVLGTASKALGYGARDVNPQVNVSFVVALPPAAASSDEWARGRTIEYTPAPVRVPSALETKS